MRTIILLCLLLMGCEGKAIVESQTIVKELYSTVISERIIFNGITNNNGEIWCVNGYKYLIVYTPAVYGGISIIQMQELDDNGKITLSRCE